MNIGQFVFSQLTSFLPRYEFDKCVTRYQGNYRVKDFTCWKQFLAMFVGNITHRESLRDTTTCLQAHRSKLYHLGFKNQVFRSTLADANERRNHLIYADFAQILITKERRLYLLDNDFSVEIDKPVYALDATTIDLCLSVFGGQSFAKPKPPSS